MSYTLQFVFRYSNPKSTNIVESDIEYETFDEALEAREYKVQFLEKMKTYKAFTFDNVEINIICR